MTASGNLQNQSGAEGLYVAAKEGVFLALDEQYDGASLYTGLLSDEYSYSAFSANTEFAPIDARFSADRNGFLAAYSVGSHQLAARSQLLIAEALLAKYEPTSRQFMVGEAFALIGYTEMEMAEDLCAGVPLDVDVPNAGFQYGHPVSTDSLLATAEAHFDSALAHAQGNDTVEFLASVGLGRTRLDRGHYADAATAVHSVPTGFLYSATMNPSSNSIGTPGANNDFYLWQVMLGCGVLNVADREGGDGLNFRSAQDPRIALDSTIVSTCDGGTWYYPTKFGNPSSNVPMSTGVEARLIEAEAALAAGGAGPGAWAADLNTLRSNAPTTYLGLSSAMNPLTADSTTTASAAMRVDVMFRERAFWLFGTGTRVGDLRRLIRQYGRGPETVFPSGPYPSGENPNLSSPIPNYGTDVSLQLPTALQYSTTNPYYRGCLSSAGTA